MRRRRQEFTEAFARELDPTSSKLWGARVQEVGGSVFVAQDVLINKLA